MIFYKNLYLSNFAENLFFVLHFRQFSVIFLILRKAGGYSAPGLSRKPHKNKGPGSIPAATPVQHILLDDEEDDEHEEDYKGDEDDEDDKPWGW